MLYKSNLYGAFHALQRRDAAATLGTRATMLIALVLVIISFFPSIAAAEVAQVYFYNKERKVELILDTNTLAIKTAASALQTTTTTSALNARAHAIRATDPTARVQAILRRPNTSATLYLTQRISFQVPPGVSTQTLAARYGLRDIQPIVYAPDTFTATLAPSADLLAPINTANKMQESGDAIWATPLIEEQKLPRASFNDPMLTNQWHLHNTGSNTVYGLAGNDMNVFPAWDTVTGAGVNIAINDEGVETTHPDLAANIRANLDHDFNDNDDDPTPAPTNFHGVACAGVAAAVGNNGIGVSGVAPDAGIIGLRLLGAPITDEQEASSLFWQATETSSASQVFVSSNSWGPSDDGATLEGPGPLTQAALAFGAQNGRSGKGILYAWACGNGRNNRDNVNKDGYANNPNVIAIASTTSDGQIAWYSDPGAAILVNAPGGSGDGLYTTDLVGAPGKNTTDYRGDFVGTSAAAPAAAGAMALILQANPALTTRDVMHILVDTATKNAPASPTWHTNGSGRAFSHDFGFGRINAAAAVAAAQTWENIPALSPTIEINNILPTPIAIPDNNATGIQVNIPVTAPADFIIEHVELETDITHPLRGDIVLTLKSPSGTVSELHPWSNDYGDNYSHWPFRTVANWGEHPTGAWQVNISDVYSGSAGTLNQLSLRIMGYQQPSTAVENWTLYQ